MNEIKEDFMIRIYLVQHGEATAKDVDPERPLTEKGTNDVECTARLLKNSGVRIERIFHSGKLRAAQTAGILAAAMPAGVEPESIKHINPNDPVPDFASSLDKFGSGSMFVGHLPFMEKLAGYLLNKDEESRIVEFKPGSVVCMSAADDADWRIEWMIRPELVV